MQLKGACIFGQSGGPTSVINASAYGVIKTALESEGITKVLGAAHGIKGILADTLYDMSLEDPAELALLKNTPSSALGSCRYKLADPEKDDTDYRRLLEVFKKHDVRYFFYNGGNDSMDTCSKISRYLTAQKYDCRVMGVPKTIDNDLAGTDHCPGYGSAAKYIATSVMEVYQDARVYDTGTVTIIECMGRNAGWLTAAASLGRLENMGPDMIYMPEVAFDADGFIAEIKACYEAKGSCLAVISEGIRDSQGVFISEYAGLSSAKDAFGHTQMGGAAAFLAGRVKNELGVKTRAIEFSLLQRCAAHLASATDVEEAFLAGATAVQAALAGESGKMVAFTRAPGQEYQLDTRLVDLAVTANAEQKFPLEWIDVENKQIREDFFAYVLPLIQGQPDITWENGTPRFAKLKKIKV